MTTSEASPWASPWQPLPEVITAEDVEKLDRLTCHRWRHGGGYWWGCTFDPAIHFFECPTDSQRSACGLWTRHTMAPACVACWVNVSDQCWFSESDVPVSYTLDDVAEVADASDAAQPLSMWDRDWTEMELPPEPALGGFWAGECTLRIMLYTGSLALRPACRMTMPFPPQARVVFEAQHFRAEIDKI